MADLWNHENPISDYEIDVPAWIEQDISPNDVAAILQGGCESGAYMPAVTYHQASATMAKHGDDVLDYIESQLGEAPAVDMTDQSWSGLACYFLSMAVELWASSVEQEIEDAIEEAEAA